jgi:hypothetical protein
MRDFSQSVLWNAALITLGAALCAYSITALAVPTSSCPAGFRAWRCWSTTSPAS